MCVIYREMNISKLWESLVAVACKQTGSHRLKTIRLLLSLMESQSKLDNLVLYQLQNELFAKCFLTFRADKTSENCSLELDLTLLKPLWNLYNNTSSDDTGDSLLSPLTRALSDLFVRAENLASEWQMETLFVALMEDALYFQHRVFQVCLSNAA